MSGWRLYHAWDVPNGDSDLRRELRLIDELEAWTRAQLHGVRQGGWRADATTAVAASAAEETYRLIDELPEWQNDTGALWRLHLQRVWEFLQGDHSQHYALSRAVADFLTSPLNHNEGQDGPDDFDRPQTVASYSAALAAIAWGVDFAVTAVRQIFEAIDLKYETEGGRPEDRWREVTHEEAFVRRVVTMVVTSNRAAGSGFSRELLDAIRP